MMRLFKYILAVALLLAGCGRVETPTGPVCVSCKPYFVRGSWHYPQRFYEYDETGLASWYGDDCHGKPKATGEIFDKMAMTAAHKTLPLPCVVKVTNLRNGKSVVVVVDDRGPYCYHGRIIDLSYGAAKALDLHRYKPSQVRVQTLTLDSLKLSHYIAKHCKKRKDPYGRSWSELYFQEIVGMGISPYRTAHHQNTPHIQKPVHKTGSRSTIQKRYENHTLSGSQMTYTVKKTKPGTKSNQKHKPKRYNALDEYLHRNLK